MLALKRLAVNCSYGEQLNQALWEQVVCGPNNVKKQNKVLNMGDLVFKKACSIAATIEGEEGIPRNFTLLSVKPFK